MIPEISIRHAEHQSITQGVKFLTGAALRNARKARIACRREPWDRYDRWASEFGIARRHKIYVELEEMECAGAEQVDKEIGFSRGGKGCAI